jgi:hypothetical protein
MPSPHLRRLAIISIAFLIGSLAPDVLPLKAADTPTSAHEAAVLDRIFANWKARHDRVHSFHFVYDCRTTHRKRAPNPRTPIVTPLEHDEVFEQFGAQLWMDGDERLCWIDTPRFKVPHAKATDTSRVIFRNATDGKTGWWYDAGGSYAAGETQAATVQRHARLWPMVSAPGRMVPQHQVHALLLTFRPEQPEVVTWLKGQCRLVDEHAVIDNGQYVEFQRVVPRGGRWQPRREETCWVSPGRDDVVVHWTIEMPGEKFGISPAPTCVGTIKYKKDTAHGWIPSEWTCEYVGRQLYEFRVTSYAINEKIDPAVFSQDFPPGTPVADARTNRYYVVQPDGSESPITAQDYRRLAKLDEPLKALNKKPAKNQNARPQRKSSPGG